MGKYHDVTNERFGRLVVKERVKPEGSFWKWLCICDCGKSVIVNYADLKRGRIKSCGCYNVDKCRDLGKKRKSYNEYEIIGNTVYVQLNDGVMKCDIEDWELLKDIKWYKGDYGYALGSKAGSKEKLSFHITVMGKCEGLIIDHINRDRLDNRKCNLRFITQRENTWNSNLRSDNKTGTAGVSKVGNKWVSRIVACGKGYYLGTFDTVEQAVDARRKAEIKYQPLPERIREDV